MCGKYRYRKEDKMDKDILQILVKNQRAHFEEIEKKHSIAFNFTDQELETLISTAVDNSLVQSVIPLSATDKVSYILSVDTTPEEDGVCTREMQMRTYKATPSEIKVISLATFQSIQNSPEDLIDLLSHLLTSTLNATVAKLIDEAANTNPGIYFDASPEPAMEESDKTLRDLLDANVPAEHLAEELQKISAPFTIHARNIYRAVAKASDEIFQDVFRGGVTDLVVPPSSAAYLQLLPQFTPSRLAPYKSLFGSLAGIGNVWGTQYLTRDTVITAWKNPHDNQYDISSLCYIHTPIYIDVETNMVSIFGEFKVLEPRFFRKINIVNMM